MADKFTKEKRSKIMSSIRGKDTSIERILRSELFSRGYRFRKNASNLPGKPDIVLPKYKTVIFVHGCFWHQHQGCSEATIPKTRTEYWKAKFQKNIQRDKIEAETLVERGWHVLIVWECELKKNLKNIVDEIEKIMHYMLPTSRRILLPEFGCFIKKDKKTAKPLNKAKKQKD